MGRVEGKVVFITGGASGLGRASAEWLVREGAKVALADLNAELGQEVADALGDAALFISHNVSDEDGWQGSLETARDHFGRLDVVVNCAGIVLPGSPVDTKLEDWRRMFTVNVDGTFLGCKYAIPILADQGGGQIINFASVASFTPSGAVYGYCASKAAVKMLSRSVALYCKEQGNNIRCNTVMPGPILTPMTNAVLDGALGQGAHRDFTPGQVSPFGVLGEANDIAGAVVYLISDDAKYANGMEMVVDGGTTL